MKNSVSLFITIFVVVISLSASAQHRSRGNEHQEHHQQYQVQMQHQSYGGHWGNGHNNGWNHWGGGVTVHIGNTPNFGYYNYGYRNNYYSNYNNNYNNYYSVKRAARYSIGQAAQTIGNALQFSDWNDTYSPWLATAIRHQQYAKQLYFWGDYAGALNHAERANFLAYNTLTYFNNGYNNGYGNNGNYQDPYQDPNNPNYRKGNSQSTNPNSTNQNNTGTNASDEDFGYRKNQDTQTNSKNQNTNTGTQSNTNVDIQKTEIDGQLPQSKLSDQELLKTNAKDLDVE